MDTLMIILRLIHIFAGTFWVGGAALLVFFISPTAKSLGPDGGKFMQGVVRAPGYIMYFPVVALLTVVSGLWMYYRVSNHFSAEFMEDTSGIVLSIGSVAGIVAFGHGGATIGPAAAKMKTLAETISAQGGPPTEEQMKTLMDTSAFINLHSRIAFGLMVIAVAGMAAARYF
jgi:uncharacterized membrane protein